MAHAGEWLTKITKKSASTKPKTIHENCKVLMDNTRNNIVVVSTPNETYNISAYSILGIHEKEVVSNKNVQVWNGKENSVQDIYTYHLTIEATPTSSVTGWTKDWLYF